MSTRIFCCCFISNREETRLFFFLIEKNNNKKIGWHLGFSIWLLDSHRPLQWKNNNGLDVKKFRIEMFFNLLYWWLRRSPINSRLFSTDFSTFCSGVFSGTFRTSFIIFNVLRSNNIGSLYLWLEGKCNDFKICSIIE